MYWLSGIPGLDLKEEIHTSGCHKMFATDLLDRTVKGVLGKAIKNIFLNGVVVKSFPVANTKHCMYY